ncbi:GspH/FimT family pseudopilin [Ferrimonas futtsuensis]|uniref:GspH/FimT family pseudopilin n=1 Tax=Ferrimonas futtsuensis TaxID=364764 RepID=UPI0004050583|nr:GspH/FimT family protein [Ferrimonas futtsuensis]
MLPGRYELGLTLVELMIALAVAAILLLWGAPSMRTLFANARAEAKVHALYHDLAQARHLALSYQAMVTLCPLSSGNQCNGQWREGYQIFIDAPPLQSLGSDDLVMVSRNRINSADHLTYSATVNAIRFDPEGFTGQNGSFYYCSDQQLVSHPVKVVISRTGRVKLEDHDGTTNCQ